MRKRPTYLTLGAVLIGFVLFLIFKIDGRYKGDLLNPLDPSSILEINDGVAYIQLPRDEGMPGEKILFGHYYKQHGVWIMKADKAGSYMMEAWLRGFDLVSSTNSSIRYRFTKACFRLPEFMDPD